MKIVREEIFGPVVWGVAVKFQDNEGMCLSLGEALMTMCSVVLRA
jgi:hypothetical protein